LCQVPRLCVRDHLVHPGNDRPCFFQRSTKRKLIEVANEFITSMRYEIRDGCLVSIDTGAFGKQQAFVRNVSLRNAAVAIALDHRQRAARKIAETARQVAVRAIDEILLTES